MGTIQAGIIIADVEKALEDLREYQFTPKELLDILNRGQREIAFFKPDSSVVTGNIDLVAGTKQPLPAGSVQLIEIVRNMGTTGNSPGTPVTLVERKVLDASYPNWHSAIVSATVIHYMLDDRDPTTFYVYPAQPSVNQGKVEAVRAIVPADVVSLASTISINDIYEPVLVVYLKGQMWQKKDPSVAQGYMNSFYQMLGVKERSDFGDSPNRRASSTIVNVVSQPGGTPAIETT